MTVREEITLGIYGIFAGLVMGIALGMLIASVLSA